MCDAWTYICTGQWTDWFLIFNVTVNCEDQLGVQELCESGGGRPGLPVAKKPDGFCGRKATLKREGYISAKLNPIRACVCCQCAPALCENRRYANPRGCQCAPTLCENRRYANPRGYYYY